jgi:hypothetical protein
MATKGILEAVAIVVTHLSDDRARQRLALDEGNKTRVEQARLLLSVGHFDDNYKLRRVASITRVFHQKPATGRASWKEKAACQRQCPAVMARSWFLEKCRVEMSNPKSNGLKKEE